MLEIVEGLPETVLGFSAKGRVTRRDYDEVLVPKVREALRRYDKIRLYYELGTALDGINPGAMWEDFKIGVGHLSRWERAAVVTDVDWIRHAVNAFRFLMPGQMRVFSTGEAAAARSWITAAG